MVTTNAREQVEVGGKALVPELFKNAALVGGRIDPRRATRGLSPAGAGRVWRQRHRSLPAARALPDSGRALKPLEARRHLCRGARAGRLYFSAMVGARPATRNPISRTNVSR